MREIKFRAWNKFSNSMSDSFRVFEKRLTYDGEALMTAVEDLILMQYTGLKDKNDKEIYEGDIVRFTKFVQGIRKPLLKEIAYVDVEIIEFRGVDGVFPFCQPFNNDPLPYDEYEIIGNIYENHR